MCAGLVTTGSAFLMSFFKKSSNCSFAENWSMKQNSIKINRVLAELDMSIDTDGIQKTFSIRFNKRNGESVFLFRTVKSVLNILMVD